MGGRLALTSLAGQPVNPSWVPGEGLLSVVWACLQSLLEWEHLQFGASLGYAARPWLKYKLHHTSENGASFLLWVQMLQLAFQDRYWHVFGASEY